MNGIIIIILHQVVIDILYKRGKLLHYTTSLEVTCNLQPSLGIGVASDVLGVLIVLTVKTQVHVIFPKCLEQFLD